MALRLQEVATVGLWILLLAAVGYVLCGCQIKTEDGGIAGFRIITGSVGIEFYHAAQETGGEGLIRTDVDQGVQNWLFDSDGDGVLDQSGPEPKGEDIVSDSSEPIHIE